MVFWTHTIEGRATGWLDEAFHSQFREVMVHACARYRLACPAYVLMPDHWHVVWMGMADGSDQRLATAFLREHIARALGDVRLQDRAHDHVLREEERKKGAFERACHYVRENPVRAGLVKEWREWSFAGAVISGYPNVDPRQADFWGRFWKIYTRACE